MRIDSHEMDSEVVEANRSQWKVGSSNTEHICLDTAEQVLTNARLDRAISIHQDKYKDAE